MTEEAPKPRKRRKPNDAILKGIRKYQDTLNYSDDDIERAADMLGCQPSRESVAVALASGVKPDTTALDSLVDIRHASDDFSAGILAHQATEDRKNLNRLWSMVAGGQPPRASTEAAQQLANHITALDDHRFISLTRVLGLMQ